MPFLILRMWILSLRFFPFFLNNFVNRLIDAWWQPWDILPIIQMSALIIYSCHPVYYFWPSFRIPSFQGKEEAMGNNYYTVNPSYIKSMIGVKNFFRARERNEVQYQLYHHQQQRLLLYYQSSSRIDSYFTRLLNVTPCHSNCCAHSFSRWIKKKKENVCSKAYHSLE